MWMHIKFQFLSNFGCKLGQVQAQCCHYIYWARSKNVNQMICEILI